MRNSRKVHVHGVYFVLYYQVHSETNLPRQCLLTLRRTQTQLFNDLVACALCARNKSLAGMSGRLFVCVENETKKIILFKK